jgi:hypothetical protein
LGWSKDSKSEPILGGSENNEDKDKCGYVNIRRRRRRRRMQGKKEEEEEEEEGRIKS